MKKEEALEQAEVLKDKVGDLFTETNIELGVVMSVLVSMLVSTAIEQAKMTPIELVRLFSQAVESYEDGIKKLEKEEEDGEVISRTTH
jgi:antitoxin component of RelBE/YafQ-DinJ toxin-antitoxin module